MNKPHNSFCVAECKIQASILLKSLRSEDIEQAKKAAKRFQKTPGFAVNTVEAIFQAHIKHKHALTVIAYEKGFKSWNDLKCQLPFIRGSYLNHWFRNYLEAKVYHQAHGGFLLPFQNQFFVCDSSYISNLGFNPEDPDWKIIGYDWAQPEQEEAWLRLYKKWMKIQKLHSKSAYKR